jgi:hypothetical protein
MRRCLNVLLIHRLPIVPGSPESAVGPRRGVDPDLSGATLRLGFMVTADDDRPVIVCPTFVSPLGLGRHSPHVLSLSNTSLP